MKKHFKAICLVLTVMFVFSMVLAGCGAQKVTEQATTVAQTTTEKAAGPDISKEVILDWYYVNNKEEIDNNLISNELSKLTKTAINATVQMHVFDWGSYQKKIDMMIAAGEKIDIMSTTCLNFKQEVAKGSFLDMTELYKKLGTKSAGFMDKGNLESCTIDGKLYAIPTPKEAGGSAGYLIRKDIIEKAGVDLTKVKTLADMTDVWAKCKAAYPSFTIMNNQGAGGIWGIMGYQAISAIEDPGDVYLNDSLKVVNQYEDKAFLDTMKLMNEWYKAGYINKGSSSISYPRNQELENDKLHAMGGQTKEGVEAEVSAGIKGKYQFTKVILQNPMVVTTTGSDCAQGIARTCTEPERAAMFIDLLYSDAKVCQLVNFGIEGQHYVKEADGRISNGPKIADYNPGAAWELGNIFILNLPTTYPVDFKDRMKEYNKLVRTSILMGFVYNPEKVKSESGACNNVYKEFEGAILSGSLAPDLLISKIIAKMKAAGSDKIIAEKQAQLDAWKK